RIQSPAIDVTQTDPLHHARTEIVDDDIRIRDQCAYRREVVGILEIERHAAFVAVEAAEDGIVVPGDGLEGGARQVARALALDLDHVRAVVSQHLRAHGAQHHLGKIDDPNAGQGQVVWLRCVHWSTFALRATVFALGAALRAHAINSKAWSWRTMDGTSGFGPDWSPGSAPCARSFCCRSLMSTSRTLTPLLSAIAAATPAASPIAMQGGISREIFCADGVAE